MEIPMHTDKREISRKFCGLFYDVNRKPLPTDDSPDTKKKGYILKRTYPLLYNKFSALTSEGYNIALPPSSSYRLW